MYLLKTGYYEYSPILKRKESVWDQENRYRIRKMFYKGYSLFIDSRAIFGKGFKYDVYSGYLPCMWLKYANVSIPFNEMTSFESFSLMFNFYTSLFLLSDSISCVSWFVYLFLAHRLSSSSTISDWIHCLGLDYNNGSRRNETGKYQGLVVRHEITLPANCVCIQVHVWWGFCRGGGWGLYYFYIQPSALIQ